MTYYLLIVMLWTANTNSFEVVGQYPNLSHCQISALSTRSLIQQTREQSYFVFCLPITDFWPR